MAIEGTEPVVESPTTESPTTDSSKGGEQKTGEQTPAKGAGPQPDRSGEYERRIAGMTADLQKERKARQQYESELRTERQDLERERKRVQIALGVNPVSDVDKERDAIKERFAQLYPELAGLTKEDIDALREMRASNGNTQAVTQHYWTQHATQMVGDVVQTVAKELGGTLSERQAKRIATAYAQEAEDNPEFLARHEKGDKTLVAEFAKQWIEDWYEPVRRKVTQQEVSRQRVVPVGKDRGIVTHGDKKIDVNDPKAVEDLLVKGFRERGGAFTR